jgi:hypothetical protein
MLFTNIKVYTISKKKKNRTKTSNAFLSLKMRFLARKMTVMMKAVNTIDIVVSFSWPRNTSQTEFSIKSYGRLKLRWSDFDFYFCFLLSFLFLSSFSLYLSSFFLYMKIYDNELVIREILFLKF